MIKCWETFDCVETSCPAYHAEDLRCWLFTGTHCRNEVQGKFIEKMELCLECGVFKSNMDVHNMEETCQILSGQMKQFKTIINQNSKDTENTAIGLSIGLSEVFEALKRIASGDPSVTLDETSDIELISKLKQVVNVTAKNIGEIVEQSHEFAIGLAEHFEVLRRVAKGEMNARVIGSSGQEIIEELKQITNRMIENISETISENNVFAQKLINASNEWRAAFDSMPYGIFLLDSGMKILKTNSYISSLLGIPIRELSGSNCRELLYGKDMPGDPPLDRKTTESLRTEMTEWYSPELRKHFMLYLTPFLGEYKRVSGYVHSLVDITDNKKKETEIVASRNAVSNMLKDLDNSFRELKSVHEGLIHSFANALDAKSPWTKGHSERVTSYSVAIARVMGVSEKEIGILRTAALLHDIGKIGTYDYILDKPGKLSDEEFSLIKTHPAKGAEILSPIPQFRDILPVIKHHHERMDGRGYPDKLSSNEIPFLSRILCVADSFDSMTSDRPYRPSPGKEFAINELRKFSGIQFDPKAVEAFLTVLNTLPD
jgi:putative nucleotidyltransferase with HDIG domain/PAS domain S-box-containing protein